MESLYPFRKPNILSNGKGTAHLRIPGNLKNIFLRFFEVIQLNFFVSFNNYWQLSLEDCLPEVSVFNFISALSDIDGSFKEKSSRSRK